MWDDMIKTVPTGAFYNQSILQKHFLYALLSIHNGKSLFFLHNFFEFWKNLGSGVGVAFFIWFSIDAYCFSVLLGSKIGGFQFYL